MAFRFPVWTTANLWQNNSKPVLFSRNWLVCGASHLFTCLHLNLFQINATIDLPKEAEGKKKDFFD